MPAPPCAGGTEQTDGGPTTASLLARAGTVVPTGTDWAGLHIDAPPANITYDLRGWVGNGYYAADAVGGFDGRAYGLPDFRSGTMSYAGATQTFPPASGTPFRNTSPFRFGNTAGATGFCVVGAKLVGQQPGVTTMPWNVIKHGTPCQVANNSVVDSGSTATNQDGNPECHTKRGSYSVTAGVRTYNGMDGFAIVGENSSPDISDTENGVQYFRNCWVSNCHDDALENDNHYLTTRVTDCLFEDIHNWMSAKDGSNVGSPSNTKAWYMKDCVVKLLARPGPSGLADTVLGHGGYYKMNANAPGIHLTNCILAAHLPANPGKLDLPERPGLDSYSNVTICWLGTGGYPSNVPAGCTLVVGAAATTTITDAIANWKWRHGVTDFDTVNMAVMLAPCAPGTGPVTPPTGSSLSLQHMTALRNEYLARQTAGLIAQDTANFAARFAAIDGAAAACPGLLAAQAVLTAYSRVAVNAAQAHRAAKQAFADAKDAELLTKKATLDSLYQAIAMVPSA